jgi:hypothetical protein
MLRNLILITGALAIGALGGIVYGNLAKDASSDAQTLAATQVLIVEPVANTAQASARPEIDGREPEAQAATAQSEGSATETSSAYRAEPAKPTPKPRPTPRLILGVGW